MSSATQLTRVLIGECPDELIKLPPSELALNQTMPTESCSICLYVIGPRAVTNDCQSRSMTIRLGQTFLEFVDPIFGQKQDWHGSRIFICIVFCRKNRSGGVLTARRSRVSNVYKTGKSTNWQTFAITEIFSLALDGSFGKLLYWCALSSSRRHLFLICWHRERIRKSRTTTRQQESSSWRKLVKWAQEYHSVKLLFWDRPHWDVSWFCFSSIFMFNTSIFDIPFGFTLIQANTTRLPRFAW